MYSWPDTVFSVAVLGFSSVVLGIARCLHPSASGMGPMNNWDFHRAGSIRSSDFRARAAD
jgi:hypothetical protein